MKNNANLSDKKKDFYLLFLIQHQGETFKPEVLLFLKEYYIKNKQFYPGNEINVNVITEEALPFCDYQTINDIKKRMNYLIELIAACQQCQNSNKQAEAKKELNFLTDYLIRATHKNGQIRNMDSSQQRLKKSVLKSINRSINSLAKSDPEQAHQIKTQLQISPEIGIITTSTNV